MLRAGHVAYSYNSCTWKAKKKEDHKFKATLGDIVYSNMEGREEARKVREIEK